MGPRRIARVAVLAVHLVGSHAGCHAQPPASPSANACGGAAGSTAPWCTEPDFPGTLPDPTPTAIRAVNEALASACPAPTETDATAGLSANGRWAVTRAHRRNQVPSAVRSEASDLDRLLEAMAPADPHRAFLLDRLAEAYAIIEVLDHERCRALRAPRAKAAYPFSAAIVVDHALDVVRSFLAAREGGFRACATLRRDYPEHPSTAPCLP
jgi:hypothetical protein